MYWRFLFVIGLIVTGSYLSGRRESEPARPPASVAAAGTATTPQAAKADAADVTNGTGDEPSFAPSSTPMSMSMPTVATATPESNSTLSEERISLNLQQESQRIAGAAGVSIGAILVTDKLPPYSPMAMTFRRGSCVLLVNSALPLDGLVLNNLSAYGKRQLTFTLGHETGHCYVMSRVARRDESILPSLSPPGKAYTFDQYAAMSGSYSEYPDLNRWNEEWADTFAAFILSRVYGKEFAAAVTDERFSLRKEQEKNDSVLMSNVYGGHASLTEDALFTIQSPLEIANLVKLGRLNTHR